MNAPFQAAQKLNNGLKKEKSLCFEISPLNNNALCLRRNERVALPSMTLSATPPLFKSFIDELIGKKCSESQSEHPPVKLIVRPRLMPRIYFSGLPNKVRSIVSVLPMTLSVKSRLDVLSDMTTSLPVKLYVPDNCSGHTFRLGDN